MNIVSIYGRKITIIIALLKPDVRAISIYSLHRLGLWGHYIFYIFFQLNNQVLSDILKDVSKFELIHSFCDPI